METNDYGLLGEHLGHSYSRQIHESLGRYSYTLMEMTPDQLDAFLKSRDFKGVNVTIPYKKTVLPYLDTVDPQAKSVGTCNCIVNRNGKLTGYNTDYDGIMDTFRKNGIDVQDKICLVIGNGGVAAAYKACLRDLGAREIICAYYRTAPGTVSYAEAMKRKDVQILINATPIGMYPEVKETPVSLEPFEKLEFVVDPVYNPFMTRLLMEAQERGIPFENGLHMLVVQAIRAAELFTGEPVSPAEIQKIWKDILMERVNIAFIGMPSSGKSTLAALLAQKTGRRLIEIDDIIVQKTGMEISEYFRTFGEDAFRAVEKEVTAHFAKQSGLILSCGGGVVLDPENIEALQQNSVIVYVDRDLSLLIQEDESRPALAAGIHNLYSVRHTLYENAADYTVKNNDRLQDALQDIMNTLKEDAIYRRLNDYDYYLKENS